MGHGRVYDLKYSFILSFGLHTFYRVGIKLVSGINIVLSQKYVQIQLLNFSMVHGYGVFIMIWFYLKHCFILHVVVIFFFLESFAFHL